jgi:hypothetical protein
MLQYKRINEKKEELTKEPYLQQEMTPRQTALHHYEQEERGSQRTKEI